MEVGVIGGRGHWRYGVLVDLYTVMYQTPLGLFCTPNSLSSGISVKPCPLPFKCKTRCFRRCVIVGVGIMISQESFILWVPDIIHICAKHVWEKESKWHLSCQCAWYLGTEYMSAGES